MKPFFPHSEYESALSFGEKTLPYNAFSTIAQFLGNNDTLNLRLINKSFAGFIEYFIRFHIDVFGYNLKDLINDSSKLNASGILNNQTCNLAINGYQTNDFQTNLLSLLVKKTFKAGVLNVVLGTNHTAFIMQDGSVYMAGYNMHGQLALGHNNKVNTLQKVTVPLNKKV